VPGTLYLLPTQLGPTDWVSVLPAGTQKVACGLRYFIVENAKTARASLKWLAHPVPLREISIEDLPEKASANEIEHLLAPLLAGQDTGLMSEAGCPGVADPGATVVRRAHALGIAVRPLVGPSSLLLALMASGLDGQRFAFHGYLPQRDPERSTRISELEKESRQKRQTQLFIETPYRNETLFDALLKHCQPNTLLCIAKNLTNADEWVQTQTIAAWRKLHKPPLERQPTVFLLLSGY
jgi:16S rRNA (cytidine1402-2'-O)-methyltransferase